MAKQSTDFKQHIIKPIIEEIERAFDGVTRDDGVTLHETWEIDCCSSDRQRAKARRLDTDRRWQDVPEADIERFYSALSFLDAKGFTYYIPAYMIWTLRNYKSSDSNTVDFTIYTFNHNTPVKDKRCILLNDLQRQAICKFLTFFVENDDGQADSYQAEIALRMGWRDYCTETNAVGEIND